MTSDETTAAEVIVAITASPSEESIICGTDSRQLYTDALSVVDIHRSDDEMMLLLPMIELFVFGTTVRTQLNSGKISLKKFILYLFIQLAINCLLVSVTSFVCSTSSSMIFESSENSQFEAAEKSHSQMQVISSQQSTEILFKPFPQLLLSLSGRFPN